MGSAALAITPEPELPAGFERVERCDLCGGEEFEPRASYPEYLLFTGETFRLVRCRGCDLHFLDPRPDRATIGRYYPQDYFAHQNQPRPLLGWQQRASSLGDRRASILERAYLYWRQSISWYWIPPREDGERVLDVGCGSGKLLDTMKKLGWETFGVEISEAAARRAEEKGHRVVVGPAEEPAFEDESFDLVYMWHALEHTHSPRRALERARDRLRPGGRLALAVPNFKSFHARLFGRYWWSSDAPRHLFQLERKTVRAYLDDLGFEDVRMTTRTGTSSWLRGFRHTLNGWFGTEWATDPGWLLGLFEVPCAVSALFRFFGVGSELRVVCRKR